MGFWLWKTFQSLTDCESDAQTEVFDLPRKGIISNLILEFYAVSGSTHASLWLQSAVTKIEVIGNGSTVIQSLTGWQAQASQAYDDGQLSHDKEMSPSGGCYGYFDIRFGRYPGDQKYALDCGKWNSLELKITYDLAAGGTKGTTGYTTATGKIVVYGLYSPDGAGLSPVGYLKKAQKKTYTTTAAGTEDLELPTDYPFRRLLLCNRTDYYSCNDPFRYVTIDVNNGARKPIDNWDLEYVKMVDLSMRGNPFFHHNAEYYLASGNNAIFPRLGFILSASYFSEDGTLVGQDIGIGHISVTAGSNCSGYVNAFGYQPDRTQAIDFERWSGGKDGRDAMLDVLGFDEKADIHFKFTEWHASVSAQVVLEQYAEHPIPV